jgi:RimJ/RimL family protein N-acetyltransferase
MYYGQLVKIRAVEMSDLPKIMEYVNTWETRRFLGVLGPMSEKAEREWLEKATTSNPWKDGNVYFAIEDKETGELLGTTGLHGVSAQDRSAELGIFIHNPENCGKGYGTDAILVVLWIAFYVLGLQSVMLHYLHFNERGRRAYEKAGFKHVGVFRKRTFNSGEYQDLVAMDILREEFAEKHPPERQIGEAPLESAFS